MMILVGTAKHTTTRATKPHSTLVVFFGCAQHNRFFTRSALLLKVNRAEWSQSNLFWYSFIILFTSSTPTFSALRTSSAADRRSLYFRVIFVFCCDCWLTLLQLWVGVVVHCIVCSQKGEDCRLLHVLVQTMELRLVYEIF